MSGRRYTNNLDKESKKDKKPKKSKLKQIIYYLSIIVFAVCLVSIINILFLQPQKNDKLNDEIRQMVYGGLEKDDDTPENRRIRMSRISEINPDIKGWVKIKNTKVDYPVLKKDKDPTFYLYRNYKGENSRYGSIFIDNTCDLIRGCKNLLLHGHSMNNGSMFRTLIDMTDLDFYKTTPVIMYDTPEEIADWKIISAFRTNTLSEHGEIFHYLVSRFKSKDDFLEYVYQVKVRSMLNTPVDVNENDELITLSTCSYEMKDFRTVIVARKVREGESSDVDLDKATWSNRPLMPEAYYNAHGGTPPSNVTNFKTALKSGNISWYSGNGDDTTTITD